MALALEGSAERARADFLLRFGRTRNAVLGALIVTVVVLVALLAPWLAPHDFELVDMLAVWAASNEPSLPPTGFSWMKASETCRPVPTLWIMMPCSRAAHPAGRMAITTG